MALPRRFTREFKLAAIQRLEMGAPVADVVPLKSPQKFTTAGGGSSAKGRATPSPGGEPAAGRMAG